MAVQHHNRQPTQVELNLAAMLDMAFQLLTFFILTFKTAPVEGQVELRMPLPLPITAQAGTPAEKNEATRASAAWPALVVTILGNEEGRISSLALGPKAVGNLPALEVALGRVLSDEGSGFDRVVVQVGSRVRYNELMQLIDVCTRQTLPNKQPLRKMSLVELPQS